MFTRTSAITLFFVLLSSPCLGQTIRSEEGLHIFHQTAFNDWQAIVFLYATASTSLNPCESFQVVEVTFYVISDDLPPASSKLSWPGNSTWTKAEIEGMARHGKFSYKYTVTVPSNVFEGLVSGAFSIAGHENLRVDAAEYVKLIKDAASCG